MTILFSVFTHFSEYVFNCLIVAILDKMDSLSKSATCSFSSVDYSNNYDPDYMNKTNGIALNTDDTDMIILSVFWKNGVLGAASYNNNLSEVQILNDVVENNLDFKILNALFMQMKPGKVVVCSLQDNIFLNIIRQLAHDGKINVYTMPTNTDDYKSYEKVQILSKHHFRFKTCMKLILSMPLLSAPIDEELRKRYMRNLVDFTQKLTVCALGALLYFVDSPLSKLNLSTNLTIMSLRIINMDDIVWMDMSTYESLQIFSAHEHPMAYNWTNNSSKNVPSIFRLLNRCKSNFGAKYLKHILTHPTKNIEVLEYRHEVIEFCLKPSNKNVMLSLINCITHCRCVLSAVVKLNNGNTSMYQWKLLYQAVTNAITFGEICEQYSEQIIFFKKVKESLKDTLYAMINCMESIIDFERSTTHDRFIVKTGFIAELDEKKLKIKNISQVLDKIIFLELKDLPSYIEECSIHKIPEVGFLLCLPFWKPSNEMTENDYKILNLEFKFQLKNNLYYKTSRCLELDKLFDEMESNISQEEFQVMTKLSELIARHWIGDLHAIVTLIAELDCLIGFADVAHDLKLIKPKMLPKEHCTINIVNGRHILQEDYVKTFVPNSYSSSKINHPIKIITGLNSSGKSIYLKQVALISYLCHIGCYVPAEYTEISVLDHIYTRIQLTESISTLMSAFMVDLRQISVALNDSTCGSLILLDEFGKGTSDINGLALLLASISNFVHRPLNLLPHVIISTHYHSLPNLLQQIINKDILYHNIKYQSMSHTIENSKMVCLYKVIDGIENQTKSMAHNIAVLNGLPTHLVQRATQVFKSIQHDECVDPMIENLRYELCFRRKQFIQKVFDLMKGENINSEYDNLVVDLENIRYP